MEERAETVYISLLGRFRVSGVPEGAWQRRGARRLVKLLALTPDHHLHREQIIDLLWPDLDPVAGSTAFRKTLSLARRAIEPEGGRGTNHYLSLRDGMLRLTSDVKVDVDVFAGLARAALVSMEPGDIRAALDAYGGDVLPEDTEEVWTVARREELRGLWLSLCRAADQVGIDAGVVRHQIVPTHLRRATSVPLVGRDTALRSMRTFLNEAWRSEGRAVLIGGEPGVGKTRFAEETALTALGDGFTVLWAASRVGEEGVAYAPMTAALQRSVAALSEPRRRDLANRYPILAALLPALRPHGGAPLWKTDLDASFLFAALIGVLEDLRGSGPLLLVLDDMHVADMATIHLLHHLATLATSRPWLILATYREDELPPAGTGLVRRLRREERGYDLTLLRLSHDAMDALLDVVFEGERLDQALRTHLWQLSLGHPLILLESIDALRARGAIRRGGMWVLTEPNPISVPASVRQVVEHRLTRLGREARAFVAIAALAGSEMRLDLAQDLLSLRGESVVEVVEECLSVGVLTEVEAGYAFPHALYQTALYESVPSVQRADWHRQIGTALEQRGGVSPGVLALHFRRGGDQAKTMHYAERAGDDAMRVYAGIEAEALYRESLELAVMLQDEAREAAIAVKLGNVLRLQGRFEEALDILARAKGIFARLDDRAGLAAAVAALGMTHRDRGSFDTGIAEVNAVLASVEDRVPPQPAAELYISLSHLLFVAQRADETLRAANRALDLAQQSGDEGLAAEALVSRGTTLLLLARREEARAALEDGIARAERRGDLHTMCRGLNNLASVYSRDGDILASTVQAERTLEVVERLGHQGWMAFVLSTLGGNFRIMGHFATARPYLERAMNLARAAPLSWYSPYAALGLGLLEFNSGNWAAARAILNEGSTWSVATDSRVALVLNEIVLAEITILEGHATEAFERLGQVPCDPPMRPQFLPAYAWAALESGGGAEAEEDSRAAIAGLRAAVDRATLAESLPIHGLILMRRGHLDEARFTFEEAVALARRLPYPFHEARAQMGWGIVARRQGHEEEGRAHLEAALTQAERIGAAALTRRIALHLA